MISNTVLIAPDAFKGTLTAPVVANAIGAGLQGASGLSADLCPIADGGEGTMEVLLGALGGRSFRARVTDPLGRARNAAFALLRDGHTAVVEVAQASGLALIPRARRNAYASSSRGTGELIAAAIGAGASTILVGAGGSASTDGGAGAIEAIQAQGGIGEAQLVVLCDVRATFQQAPALYGPQKGADPDTVRRLQRRLRRLARELPRDPDTITMGGAAGGLAGGLWSVFGAQLIAGAAFVLDAVDFDARMRRARAVVLGEGRLDRSTLNGKAPFEVATRARQGGVPAYAVTGDCALDSFDARIMDLQVILEARDERRLVDAGGKLSQLV